MKKFFLLQGFLCLLAPYLVHSQNYTPISLTGYNHDAIAEVFPNSMSTTDTVLDGSNYVMYSQAFATAGGFQGGLPNSGLITDPGGTRQFQLAPYTGFNVLNVMRNATRTFSLVTPAPFQRLTVLAFSTEGPSMVTVTLNFTDGTSTTVATAVTLPDWFGGTANLAMSGIGRVTRTATATTVNGVPGDPDLYYMDINLPCAARKKNIQSISFQNVTTTGTNAPYPNTVLLAVSGQADTQAVAVNTVSASCGSPNGSATAVATGNSGPYTFSWSTVPVQTTATVNALPAGAYTLTVTDGSGCTSTYPVNISMLPSPTTITATATPATVCSGSPTQLSVTATGAALATYSWLPGSVSGATVSVSPTVTTTYTVLGLDAAGCPYSRQVTVVVNQNPAAPVVPSIQVCQGSQAVLAVQSPQAGYTYNWYSTATGGSPVFSGPTYTIASPVNATFYVQAVSSSCGSTTRTPVSVAMLPMPLANAGGDVTIVEGDVVQLNGTGSPGVSVTWSPATALSSATILNPMANPNSTVTYTLSVQDPLGCIATDDVTVTVLPFCVLPMGAFSPNGDGMNDVWRITNGSCLEKAEVSVYNRYGSLVYENKNYKNTWDGTYDGKPVPDGTYYYVINYKLVNGKLAFRKGNVTILR
jgi:gliding motility-associated-like protein